MTAKNDQYNCESLKPWTFIRQILISEKYFGSLKVCEQVLTLFVINQAHDKFT